MLIHLCAFIAISLSLTGFILPDEIHDAAKAGNMEQLQKLFSVDASLVGSLDENRMTPLHYAIEAGQLGAASLLINSGAHVNAPDYQQRTPLHLAAYTGNADAVKLLLQSGADPALREIRERIPLMLAIG